MIRPHPRKFRPQADPLESRQLLTSTSGPWTMAGQVQAPDAATMQRLKTLPLASVRSYYGLDNLTFPTTGGTQVAGTGQGQTIVILSDGSPDASYVDSSDPNWSGSALALFSKTMGLPDDLPGSTSGHFNFTMVDQDGNPWATSAQAAAQAAAPTQYRSDLEFDMDTQAAHAIAPLADIIVVEARNFEPANLTAAINTAINTYHPAVISMSYAWSETIKNQAAPYPDAAGTTYVQSAGDHGGGIQNNKAGSPTPTSYRALSWFDPRTVIVGGSKLKGAPGSFTDVVWGQGQNSHLTNGSGGGYSTTTPRQDAQVESPYLPGPSAGTFPVPGSVGKRLAPDLSMMASPGLAVLVYTRAAAQPQTGSGGAATPAGTYRWDFGAGSSLSAPMFAGVMAVVDQGRNLAGLPSLSSTDTLHFIYQAPPSSFNDIVSGSNGYAAGPGYDLASGRGAVQAGLIQYLAAATYPTTLQISSSALQMTAPGAATLTARVAAANSTTVPAGTVTFREDGRWIGASAVGSGGTATFRYTPKQAGVHTFTATFAASSGMDQDAHANSVTVTVTAKGKNKAKGKGQSTTAPSPSPAATPADGSANVDPTGATKHHKTTKHHKATRVTVAQPTPKPTHHRHHH